MTIALQPNLSAMQDWWASLKHGGLLIAPSKLSEFFVAESLSPLPRFIEDRLRRDVTRLQNGEDDHLSTFLDTVLEEVLGLTGDWQKGSQVDRTWSYPAITREVIRPRRVWLGAHGEVLPVFVADGQEAGGKVTRLGIGRGKRAVSRVVEWLRKANQKIALLTNGYQWRLIHAGADYDAWCEWDVTFWFEEGQPSSQVTALRLLLGQQALQTDSPMGTLRERTDVPSPLLAAIAASRQGQAELSEVLGERVRQAVELLIRESAEALAQLMATSEGIESRHVYIAATRIIMRCVVILFAEARDLLPRDNPIYHSAYGLQGLREQLDRRAGGRAAERLRQGVSSWSRLLALFKLVYEGCAHEALPVPQYGGGLFEPGNPAANDPILRALSAFENPSHTPSDAVVYRILELLCRSKVKVRQGRRSTWVEAPVDFSDLSSEYIGILYEGLLDFELRQATADEPMIFLNLGDQPVLPLARLEGMDDKTLAALVEKLKQKAKAEVEGEGEEGEDAESDEAEPEESEELDAEADTEPEAELDVAIAEDADQLQQLRDRAQQWAVRAVKAGNLVPKPRSKKADAQAVYEQAVGKAASALIARVVLPGEWFLVRWGGTRKGSGTFYTRPQLAIPTVQRTLLPLAYNPPLDEAGQPDEKAPASAWTPKTPIEILNLKICDPACGSASFLLAALRFLLEALWRSLFYHGWLVERGEEIVVSIPLDAQPEWFAECVKELPVTVEKAEERSKPRLKRFIVERCLYGVDINPLAVELGRLALWVETMDKYLPFGFLDHKIKCGNALVGCWFDQFRDYPALAWEREGGDKNHNRGVHFKQETWTKAIKEVRNGDLKKDLRDWIQGKRSIFEEIEGKSPEIIHDEAFQALDEIHTIRPDHPVEQKKKYIAHISENPAFLSLREAFDTWCAIWFWPADELEQVPLPSNLDEPYAKRKAIVNWLAQEYKFFHWELEYPDVFTELGSGFDAVIGNPPWENLQPNPAEFFSNVDPLFRTYGRLEGLAVMKDLFERVDGLEREWLIYCSRFKAYANWVKNAFSPFGDGGKGGNKFSLGSKSEYLHSAWTDRRVKNRGYSDTRHPFCFQGGGRVFTYKLFLELAHALLADGGRFSLVVPSGVYSDKGSTELRELLLQHCQWTHLYTFQNERFIFSTIHHSFKISVLSATKGSNTSSILSRFRLGPGDSPEGHELETDIVSSEKYIAIPASQIISFSPKTKSLLEIRSEQDLNLIKKIYDNSVRFGGDDSDGWQIGFTLEFMMNTDVKLFPDKSKWETKGYLPDEYGHWIEANWKDYAMPSSILERPKNLILSFDRNKAVDIDEVTDIALPLYEGRMIGQFDFSEKGWVSGKGRSAIWKDIEFSSKIIQPQFLMQKSTFYSSGSCTDLKIAFMDVTSAINTRTMIASLLPGFPCGNSAAVLTTQKSAPALVSILNSFVYDYVIRAKCSGLHLNYFVIEGTPLPKIAIHVQPLAVVELLALRLNAISPVFSKYWLKYRSFGQSFKSLWAITPYERLRLRCILDAVIAELYGLTVDDFAWILRQCDYPAARVCDKPFSRTLEPKAFWRVDKEKDPELRHTVLSLIAFHELKQIGLEAFLNLNDGEGWMLPEILRLEDYGLGHDDRAKEHQPVATRLGDRFLPWQLEGTPEESWKECEQHAENLQRLLKYSQQVVPTDSYSSETVEIVEPLPPADPNFQQPTDIFGNPLEVDLFGNIVDKSKKKRRT